MNRLHISIIDKKNNETLVDTDTNVIIGALDEGKTVHGISYMHCDPFDLAGACVAAQQMVDRVKTEHPEVKVLMDLILAKEAAQK